MALSADLGKMSHMILMNKYQFHYQRIFCRFSSTEPVKSYSLLTVTYGTASAPFLAMRALHQLAPDYEKSFPDRAKIISKNFYVQDLLAGADSVPEARRLVKDLIQVIGRFTTRKCECNDLRVVPNLPNEMKSFELYAESEDKLKIILQGLWKDNVSGVDQKPNTILSNWEEFASGAELLKSIEIPRFLKRYMRTDSRIEMRG
ncbi:hypothetical protein AVEN_228547-1 [Araneus ventricosus]|uniref:Reverse transcriptase domain-containing protein n=1 Tax=Araneus ventricosus TaxID=182803 RepID=A0A4Y2MXR1_ARAVE|nr:hypothetical protein AVEN_228547-1 [Araneus ventricosus]